MREPQYGRIETGFTNQDIDFNWGINTVYTEANLWKICITTVYINRTKRVVHEQTNGFMHVLAYSMEDALECARDDAQSAIDGENHSEEDEIWIGVVRINSIERVDVQMLIHKSVMEDLLNAEKE